MVLWVRAQLYLYYFMYQVRIANVSSVLTHEDVYVFYKISLCSSNNLFVYSFALLSDVYSCPRAELLHENGNNVHMAYFSSQSLVSVPVAVL